MPVQKVCECCKKEFSVPPRRHEAVKFCSRKCRTEAGWRNLVCPVCGESFRRKKSDHSDSLVSYCSTACSAASMIGEPSRNQNRTKTFANCELCGKEFQITSTRKDSARWCGIKCKGESPAWKAENSERQQGEKHWRWAGGTYQNKFGYVRSKKEHHGNAEINLLHRLVLFNALLEADPNHPFLIECDGKKKLSPEIEVHHIDRNRSNNELSNLLAVTKHAHAQIHHRNKKPNPWECWPSNPLTW